MDDKTDMGKLIDEAIEALSVVVVKFTANEIRKRGIDSIVKEYGGDKPGFINEYINTPVPGDGYAHGGLVDQAYVPDIKIPLYSESLTTKKGMENLNRLKGDGIAEAIMKGKRLGEMKTKGCGSDTPYVGCTCGDKKEPAELSDLEKLIATETVFCLTCGTLIKSKDDMVYYQFDCHSVIGIGGASCSACVPIGGIAEDTSSFGDDVVKSVGIKNMRAFNAGKDRANRLIDQYLGKSVNVKNCPGDVFIVVGVVVDGTHEQIVVKDDLGCHSHLSIHMCSMV